MHNNRNQSENQFCALNFTMWIPNNISVPKEMLEFSKAGSHCIDGTKVYLDKKLLCNGVGNSIVEYLADENGRYTKMAETCLPTCFYGYGCVAVDLCS